MAEPIKPSRNVSVVLLDPALKRIMMVRRRDNHLLTLPGGGVELRNGEDDFPAAERETQEEVPGLSNDYYDLDGARTSPNYVFWVMADHHLKSFLLAILVKTFEPPADEDEYRDEDIEFARWITLEDYRHERRSQIPEAHQRAIDWFLKILNI